MDGIDKKVDISVIICVYNGGELFKKNIGSVSRLKIPDNTRVEFLFVDNNSTDGSKEIIKEYTREYPDTFRYLFEPKPGKSYALNLAIKEARGEILAFTDADVILPENWLLRIKEGFEKHDCAALGGMVLPVWDGRPPKWLEKDLNTGKGGPFALSICIEEGYYSKTGPIGANMAVKKECFRKYGLFRTDLGVRPGIHLSSEDTDFCERIIHAGGKVLYYPPVTVYHQIPKYRMTKRYLFQEHFLSVLSGLLVKKRKVGPSRKDFKSLPTLLFKLTLTGFMPARLTSRSAIRYKLKVHGLLYRVMYKYAGKNNTLRVAKMFGLIDEKQVRKLMETVSNNTIEKYSAS